MFCCDTGSIPAVHIDKMVHVPHITVAEAKEVNKAFGMVKTVDCGNGEVCIPFLNGIFDKVKTTILSYTEALAHPSRKKKHL